MQSKKKKTGTQKSKKGNKAGASNGVRIGAVIIIIAAVAYIVFSVIGEDKPPVSGNNGEVTNVYTFKKEGELTIYDRETKEARVKIDIEIADTDERRARGLMERESMGEKEGMLFIFPQVQPLSFYMKNTKISLDMLFIDENRNVINIAKLTEPFTLSSYRSERPGKYVLEVNAGFCDRYLVKAGDSLAFRRTP
jgi:uncharacterized membrane protein (UPF0127 family)